MATPNLVIGTNGNDDLSFDGTSGADIINGLGGADTLIGGAGDTLVGGAGKDDLWGDPNSVLEGDQGDDIIQVPTGNVIMVFNKGDGHDRLFFEAGFMTIKFGAGITLNSLSYNTSTQKLTIAGTTDSISVGAGVFDGTQTIKLITSDGTGILTPAGLSRTTRVSLSSLQPAAAAHSVLSQGAHSLVQAMSAFASGAAPAADAASAAAASAPANVLAAPLV